MASESLSYHARLTEYLFSNIAIHVFGGSGPTREIPLECFRPFHQSYRRRPQQINVPPIESSMADTFPGGSMRLVESTASQTGSGIVYDRDLVTTWRLAGVRAAEEIFF